MKAIDRQTVAFEYIATNSLDGSTLATAPKLSTADDNDEQFYVGEPQSDLGIIVPNTPTNQEDDSQGCRGNRWITWIEIRMSGPAPAGSKIELVDLTSMDGGPAALLKEIADYSGETVFYSDAGFMVPQGGAIRLRGGPSAIVRLHVTWLDPQSLGLLAALSISSQSQSQLGAQLLFSDAVSNAAGTVDVPLNILQRYDASGLANGALVLRLPANPKKDDTCGITEVGNSTVEVTVDGNGNGVVSPTLPPAATQTIDTARQTLTWQFDGAGAWRLV